MAVPEDEAKKQAAPEADLATEEQDETTEVIEVEEPETDPDTDEVAEAQSALSPEEALTQALEEVARFKDTALRAQAEMENIQKRAARDVENAHKYGIERFVEHLLPVVDSIEKAVEAAGDQEDAMAEGVRLCQKLLIDVLGKEGVELLDPVGEPFDPNEHQAMSMVENADMEPNSVLAVVQKGVRLNGRLVRAAMVMVTKAPE